MPNNLQVLLRSCDARDKAQWATFKEKVQEEATLVKDISAAVACFKDQPGRVADRGGVASKRAGGDADAVHIFSDKDVNSFPSRPQVQKQAAAVAAAPRQARAQEHPEQRCPTLLPSALPLPHARLHRTV